MFASSSAAAPCVEPQAVDWPAKRVRDTFIEFFERRGHVFSPWIKNQTHLTSAWSEVLCIRAGGDDHDVGNDHTLLEILCNWSRDYFKNDAILLAWQLLTQVYKLPKDRFYVTYFGGDEKVGLAPDHEARDIWLKLLPTERVLPFGCKDNFWEMGDTGPCGPYSEIFYDKIGNRDAASLVHMNDPTCIEIWDLLFVQFNRNDDGSLATLPVKYVDTFMDLKRLISAFQSQDIETFNRASQDVQDNSFSGQLMAEEETGVLVVHEDGVHLGQLMAEEETGLLVVNEDDVHLGQLMAEDTGLQVVHDDGVDPFVRGLHNLLQADSPDTRKTAFWHHYQGYFQVANTIRLRINGPSWRRFFGPGYSAQEFQKDLLRFGFVQPWRNNEGDKSKAKLWRFGDKKLFGRDSTVSTLQQIKANRVPD